MFPADLPPLTSAALQQWRFWPTLCPAKLWPGGYGGGGAALICPAFILLKGGKGLHLS